MNPEQQSVKTLDTWQTVRAGADGVGADGVRAYYRYSVAGLARASRSRCQMERARKPYPIRNSTALSGRVVVTAIAGAVAIALDVTEDLEAVLAQHGLHHPKAARPRHHRVAG
ncbi:MAG: hypothetical protein M3Z85_00445 [Acidobacteriota bacterium]|nr:hypothetical protein [Acidobacteriota bacterium]